jgi:hypothetical protein
MSAAAIDGGSFSVPDAAFWKELQEGLLHPYWLSRVG